MLSHQMGEKGSNGRKDGKRKGVIAMLTKQKAFIVLHHRMLCLEMNLEVGDAIKHDAVSA